MLRPDLSATVAVCRRFRGAARSSAARVCLLHRRGELHELVVGQRGFDEREQGPLLVADVVVEPLAQLAQGLSRTFAHAGVVWRIEGLSRTATGRGIGGNAVEPVLQASEAV